MLNEVQCSYYCRRACSTEYIIYNEEILIFLHNKSVYEPLTPVSAGKPFRIAESSYLIPHLTWCGSHNPLCSEMLLFSTNTADFFEGSLSCRVLYDWLYSRIQDGYF